VECHNALGVRDLRSIPGSAHPLPTPSRPRSASGASIHSSKRRERMRGISKAAGAGLVLGVVFAANAATLERPAAAPASECELTAQAESVPVRPDSVVLRMVYSEPI